ncbi:MAG: sensor histidine kinase, partial [Anaerolineales bacterium]|nr:sensor histidine kinase [Anaerolineales bacterium]
INGVVELMRDVTEEKHLAAQRVELLRRVLSAQEDERKRIARELHDETSQTLTALLYALDTAAPAAETPESLRFLEKTRQLTQSASDGVHKIMFALRPRMLDQLGLVAAVRLYAKSRLDELGIQVEITERGRQRRLNSSVETELFRTLQEAINNIARHADARKVQLTFDFQEDALEISVEDDGIGFDVEQVPASADGRRGLGLVSMEERVSIVGGEFSLHSTAGQGTTVRIRVPLKENEDDTNSSAGR